MKKWDNIILEIDEDEEAYSDDGEKGEADAEPELQNPEMSEEDE